MFLPYIFLTLFLTEWVRGDTCPTKYLRFSPDHSFCTGPDEKCPIKVRGLYNVTRDIPEIRRIHNMLRNKVALGEEKEFGILPPASNMMKLKWDHELAEIAQKWAESCKFSHDCNECRLVENFPVGQNLAYIQYPCVDEECDDEFNGKKPNWTEAIHMFYDEVKKFNKKDIGKFGPGVNIGEVGQFTQMIWANTWKIGCGFVAYLNNSYMRNVFVCNYGPTGNVNNKPIYVEGKPCSNCPINSCCGEKCAKEVRFPGLCRMQDNAETPIYVTEPVKGQLFSCNFTEGVKDCKRTSRGVKPVIKKTALGNVVYYQVKEGEEIKVSFDKTITSEENFCLRITYRKGAVDAGHTDTSSLEVIIAPKGGFPINLPISYINPHTYMPFVFDIPKVKNLRVKIAFSVPEGEPDHIFELKEVEAHTGSCNRKNRA